MIKFSRQANLDLADKVKWLTDPTLRHWPRRGLRQHEPSSPYVAELLKLQARPAASRAGLKLADAARQFDDAHSDKMLAGLNAELVKLEAIGPAASSAVQKLQEQILKVKAKTAGMQVAENLHAGTGKDARRGGQEHAGRRRSWWDALAKGADQGGVSMAGIFQGRFEHLEGSSAGLQKKKDDTFPDLAKKIE